MCSARTRRRDRVTRSSTRARAGTRGRGADSECRSMSTTDTYDGGCTCRHVRYRMTSAPLFVHCCHCRWCQRETGSAFVLNAMIEAERVQLLAGDVDVVDTPSSSGKGQKIARCPKCRVAVWSNYGGG